MANYCLPPFAADLFNARAPSGHEHQAQIVFDRYIRDVAQRYQSDTFGNRLATINPGGAPSLLVAGNYDEAGFIITFVTRTGFLQFASVGMSPDPSLLVGRQVRIQGGEGIVFGVVGGRPPARDEPEKKRPIEIHDLWIDIGVRNRKEALQRVAVGDVATYDTAACLINGRVAIARSVGRVTAYIAGESIRRLQTPGTIVAAEVTAVACAQRYSEARGLKVAAYAVNPQVALTLDIGVATDHPESNFKRHGELLLGHGPIIYRGAGINSGVFERLCSSANHLGIPYQIAVQSTPGNQAAVVQATRAGIFVGALGIACRYPHAPLGVIDFDDVEKCVALVVAFACSLKGDSVSAGAVQGFPC
jgi:putative aminopeptidase FrvX